MFKEYKKLTANAALKNRFDSFSPKNTISGLTTPVRHAEHLGTLFSVFLNFSK